MAVVHDTLPLLAKRIDEELCLQAGKIESDCGNRFSVVGYGGRQAEPRLLQRKGKWTVTSSEMNDLVLQLNREESLLPRDSYQALSWAMHNVPLRHWPELKMTSLRTVILFASAPREHWPGVKVSSEMISAELHANHFLFHAVVNTTLTVMDVLPLLGVMRNASGFLPEDDGAFTEVPILGRVSANLRAAMVQDYVQLVFYNGGSVWDMERMVHPQLQSSAISALLYVLAHDQQQVGNHTMCTQTNKQTLILRHSNAPEKQRMRQMTINR